MKKQIIKALVRGEEFDVVVVCASHNLDHREVLERTRQIEDRIVRERRKQSNTDFKWSF